MKRLLNRLAKMPVGMTGTSGFLLGLGGASVWRHGRLFSGVLDLVLGVGLMLWAYHYSIRQDRRRREQVSAIQDMDEWRKETGQGNERD